MRRRSLWMIACLLAALACEAGGASNGVTVDPCEGLEEGALCDDDDPCTAGERCAAGACAGGHDVCVVCEGLAAGAACEDGDPCTHTDRCDAGVCAGEALDCVLLDGPCEVGACEPSQGACVAQPLPDGSDCDDGDPLTIHDVCEAGVCGGLIDSDFCHGAADGTTCDDGNPCSELDRCGDGICLGKPMSGGPCAWPCVQAGVCVEGACEGTPVVCGHLDGLCAVGVCQDELGACAAEPLADDLPCDDQDACTSGERCQAGVCEPQGAVDCDDGDPCTDDTCDPDGGCQHANNEAPCDDGDPCTQGEACAQGLCAGGLDLCVCADQADGAPCDDGRLCTEHDRCLGGACVGAPRACPKPAEPCLQAVCVEQTGECASTLVDDGASCDDGSDCTEGDFCAAGVCAGQPLPDGAPCAQDDACRPDAACEAGICEGEVKDCGGLGDQCTVGACDPASGDCVVVPRLPGLPCDDSDVCTAGDACLFGACFGAPLDCGHVVLGQEACQVGVCQPDHLDGVAFPMCMPTPIPDGTPCDDGDPCTGHDVCGGGLCAGALELCEGCAEGQAGDACDDGDACTGASGDACAWHWDGADGTLRCAGDALDCAALDSPCTIGVCADGGCEALPRPDGAPCDDLNPCTLSGACHQGACYALFVPLCGAPVDACELQGPDTESITLLVDDPYVDTPWDEAQAEAGVDEGDLIDGVLGVIEAGDEQDLYHVELLAAQTLSAELGPHCASALDTRLHLWGPDGALVASDDDGGEGAWSRLTAVEIPADGRYTLAVSAYGDAGLGTYVLTASATPPPLCLSDADCLALCPDLACLPKPGVEDLWVCGYPHQESEPNDLVASATPLTPGVELQGALSAGEDDWFQVLLPANVQVDVVTRPACGAGADTEIEIFYGAALLPVAQDADSGPGGMAALDGWVTELGGAYFLRVRGKGGASGPYLLALRDAGCDEAAPCGCEDQHCVDAYEGDGFGGVCRPVNPASELAGDEAAPLALGERVHGRIEPAGDEDWFEIVLDPGLYDVRTLAYCGAALDTRLTLVDGAGVTVASDEDSGGDGLAAVLGHALSAPGTVRVRVSAQGAVTGDYVLLMAPATDPGTPDQ